MNLKGQTFSVHLNIGFVESNLNKYSFKKIFPAFDYADIIWDNCTSYWSNQLQNTWCSIH